MVDHEEDSQLLFGVLETSLLADVVDTALDGVAELLLLLEDAAGVRDGDLLDAARAAPGNSPGYAGSS
jgi:hypothetical protein